MEPCTLNLPLLGERPYLQGATLFEAVSAFAPPQAPLSFKCSRMIHSNCVAVAEAGPEETPDALLIWTEGETATRVGIRGLAPTEPVERRPYPEQMVTRQAEICGPSSVLEAESPFPLISTTVAMFKSLLAHEQVATGQGKWIFTRLELPTRVGRWRRLEVQLAKVFAGQLARAAILADGTTLGSIYFSWIK